ncbi:hypothetical protein BDZ94DRAFT_1243396 [Collybia nuda]|uniref:DRBM domain-containing protein n=1 Tax=Collybia nuda TaxID=64659 RepID=A0A9P5YH74_9AGAR|nr:hypothetical protein BDZ94DRAFT_1243396 [Collybia nuda]
MMAGFPPLPKIEGDLDLVLDVYTHNSLRFGGAPMNDDYGDTDRLAELGCKILELAVTFHFYSKKPMLNSAEISEKSKQATSDENLARWLDAYALRQKLRFAPSEKDSVGSPAEIRRFFHTYIGALHIRNGMQTIQAWISQLIDPEAEPTYMDPLAVQSPGYQGQPAVQQPPQYPGQPAGAPPPLPTYQPSSPSNNGSPQTNLVSLALVNQTAMQRGYVVTYPAEQEGQSHQPTWTVRCCFNGQEYGRGIGRSQKIAKEEAARQAWQNIGW